MPGLHRPSPEYSSTQSAALPGRPRGCRQRLLPPREPGPPQRLQAYQLGGDQGGIMSSAVPARMWSMQRRARTARSAAGTHRRMRHRLVSIVSCEQRGSSGGLLGDEPERREEREPDERLRRPAPTTTASIPKRPPRGGAPRLPVAGELVVVAASPSRRQGILKD